MRSRKAVFDDDFYRLGAILLSEKFSLLKSKYYAKFEKLNHPIPPNGFRNNIEYTRWRRGLDEMGNGLLPRKEIEEIIKEFGLTTQNQSYYVGLYWAILFNKKFGSDFIAVKSPISLRWGGNASPNEAIITIYPWTRQKDFYDLWNHIKEEVKKANYKEKDTFRPSFERDYLLYLLYKKRKNEKKAGKQILDASKRVIKALQSGILDDPEAKQIFKKYCSISAISEVKKIINYFNKLLSGISLE